MSSFGLSSKPSTSLQLARLVEKVIRDVSEKRLKGAVFLDVAKDFDTVCVDGLVKILTPLNLPSYLLCIITSYLCGSTSATSFKTATYPRRGIRAGVQTVDYFPPSYLVCMSTTCLSLSTTWT